MKKKEFKQNVLLKADEEILRNSDVEPTYIFDSVKNILEEIKNLGCDIVITSDCHNAENLGYGFKEAVEYVKDCGFNKVKILTKRGFEDRNI